MKTTPISTRSSVMLVRQVCVPDYRRGFFDALDKRTELAVFTGPEFFDPTIRAISDNPRWLNRRSTWFLLGRRCVWLEDMGDAISSGGVLVYEMNPRILSIWRDWMVCRRRGMKFVFWGHATGRSGESGLAFRIRKWMLKKSDGLLCYTETEAAKMRALLPEHPVMAAPNACLNERDCRAGADERERDTVIYVGRVVKAKKVRLLVEAFAAACKQDPAFGARLVIIGDGPERNELQARATELGIGERVEWRGHQSDVVVLGREYERAYVSVSPGYVGLSLTQSFAFGVPALISQTETHSPEIEAARPGWNASFFKTDDVGDLGAKLLWSWRAWRGIAAERSKMSAWTAQNYSFERMADRFCEMKQAVLGGDK